VNTRTPIKSRLATSKAVGLATADLDTASAARTSVLGENHLPLKVPGLGVAAPPAPQGAAFEKEGCPNAGAIMEAPALDIE
jgi:hypothetical protein